MNNPFDLLYLQSVTPEIVLLIRTFLSNAHFNYVHKQIKENNETVLVIHFMRLLILSDKYFLKNMTMVWMMSQSLKKKDRL